MIAFSQYTNFDDFCTKNNFNYREGIENLDDAIAVLEKEDEKI